MSGRHFPIGAKLLRASLAASLAWGGSAAGADRHPAPPPARPAMGCDYMGTGFIKLEGTDTCVKISGSVRLDVGTSLPRADVFSASGH